MRTSVVSSLYIIVLTIKRQIFAGQNFHGFGSINIVQNNFVAHDACVHV